MQGIKLEETINQRITRYRKMLGYSQTQAADLLDMKHSTYSLKERGGDIDCETIMKISDVFGVDVKVLLYGENANENGTGTSVFQVNTQERRLIEAIRYIKPKHRDLIYEITAALVRGER